MARRTSNSYSRNKAKSLQNVLPKTQRTTIAILPREIQKIKRRKRKVACRFWGRVLMILAFAISIYTFVWWWNDAGFEPKRLALCLLESIVFLFGFALNEVSR